MWTFPSVCPPVLGVTSGPRGLHFQGLPGDVCCPASGDVSHPSLITLFPLWLYLQANATRSLFLPTGLVVSRVDSNSRANVCKVKVIRDALICRCPWFLVLCAGVLPIQAFARRTIYGVRGFDTHPTLKHTAELDVLLCEFPINLHCDLHGPSEVVFRAPRGCSLVAVKAFSISVKQC